MNVTFTPTTFSLRTRTVFVFNDALRLIVLTQNSWYGGKFMLGKIWPQLHRFAALMGIMDAFNLK
jgi:hypothetical protein